MDFVVPKFSPKGIVKVPSSKSYSHRFLIAAFISNKPAIIQNVNLSDDVIATINALKALGGNFDITGTTVKFINREISKQQIVIDANESASTLRMLLPIASYLYENVKFIGKSGLFSRPLDIYQDILRKQNVITEKGSNYLLIKGKIKVEDFEIKGNISSQFISGILFLYALTKSSNKLTILPPCESENYVDMTIETLHHFGFQFSKNNLIYSLSNIVIPSDNTFDIEEDYSLMSNFLVLGATNGDIKTKMFNKNTIQGDSRIIQILHDIGSNIKLEDGYYHVSSLNKLMPFDVDISNCIDLGPILFVLASLIEGTSRITGVERLKYKESDRLNNMMKELSKINIETIYTNNQVIIKGRRDITSDVTFSSYNDHRIAMALAILGFSIKGKVTIDNVDCVNKSYGNFVNDLMGLSK